MSSNGSTGTTSVSGLASGIDWESTIQQLMTIEARRKTLLQNRRDENSTKLSLWTEIQSKVSALQSAMEGMDQRSEFAVKSASSSDATLVAVSANASAAAGAHTVEVLQLAKAHRIAAQGWADKNATGVGDSGGNFVIQVNGKTITIADADLSSSTTLEQLCNLINSSPDNDNLVTASIVDDGSSTNQYRLVLASDSTGVDNRITISSNPTSLDFVGTKVDAAETQTGWTGTSAVSSSGTYAGTTNKSYSFTVAGSGSQTVGAADITLNWVDSLGHTGTTVIPTGYGGAPVAVAEGVQLSFAAGALTGGESFDVDVYTPQLTAAQDARVAVDGIYMNKASNSITDVLDGVTLNLNSAKPGTVVDLSIANDTESVKAKIQDFVDAYNTLMGETANFSSYDEKNKTAAPLLGDGFLSDVRASLSMVPSQILSGLPPNSIYDSLAVLGIKGGAQGQLTIDDAKLTDALENHFDDVVSLFTQTFTSDDPKVGFVTANEKTVAGKFALVVNYDNAGLITSATIDGHAAKIDGRLIHGAEGTSAEGLVMSFSPPVGTAGSLSTGVRYSPGAAGAIAAQAIKINDTTDGPIHFATDSINQTNESLDRQIAEWDDRLAQTEKDLRRQYANLETLISQMKNQSAQISGTLG
jgi:flagellar hook-associated protein 2